MKKQILFAVAILFASVSFAQKGKISAAKSAIAKGDYKTAYAAVEAATKHKKTLNNPEAWALKAQVLTEVEATGAAKLLGVKAEKGAGLIALKKAKELDTEGKYAKIIEESASAIIQSVHNAGANAYTQDKDYEKAAVLFKQKLDLVKEFTPNAKVDNIDYVVVLDSYQKLDQYENALPYAEALVANKYNDRGVYYGLLNYYDKAEKGDDYLRILKAGQENIPSENNFQLLEVDYLVKNGQAEEKLDELKKTAEQNPDNEGLLATIANIYKGMGDFEGQAEYLQKTLAVNPDNTAANFNLGVNYFNQAVQFNDELNFMSSTTTPEYKAAKENRDALAAKAFPYFEKAYEAMPEDQAIINAMYQYYSMKGDKANRAKFEALLED